MGNVTSHSSGAANRRLSRMNTFPHRVPIDEPYYPEDEACPYHVDLSLSSRIDLSPEGDRSFASRCQGDDDQITELASNLRERLTISRSASMVSRKASPGVSTISKLSHSANTSHFSSESGNHSIDLEATIRILRELKKSASPEDLAALREALLPNVSTTNLQARSKLPDRSPNSLIRRSSFAVPGLATRDEEDSTPISPSFVSRPWNENMFDTSPLARLASLGRPEAPSAIVQPRAETPCDVGYSHLGGLKLGSLVVTNGAASPVPSVRSTLPLPAMPSSRIVVTDEDYYTASEGCSPVPVAEQQEQARNKRLSPLKYHVSVRSTATAASFTSRYTTGDHLACDADDVEVIRRDIGNGSRKSAPSWAQNYMSELPDSPFEETPESTYRDEALAILDGSMSPRVVDLDLDMQAIAHVVEREEAEDRVKGSRPSKADSGYSSEGSLKEEVLESEGPDLESTASEETRFPSTGPHPILPASEFRSRSTTTSILSRFSLKPAVTTRSLTSTPESKTESPTEPSSTPSKQTKLQKYRKPLPAPLVLQSVRSIEAGSIPSIPAPIAAGFSKRLSKQPDMEHLTKTYESVDHVEPIDERVTTEPLKMQIRFPSPERKQQPSSRWSRARSQPPRPAPRLQNTSSYQSARDDFASQATQKTTRRWSKNNYPEPQPLQVADLGDVATYLGGSPYDVALPPTSRAPLAPGTTRTHPHQLSVHIPSRPAITQNAGMDEATAANYARSRSAHRTQTEYLEMTKSPQSAPPVQAPYSAKQSSQTNTNSKRNTAPAPLDLNRPLPPTPLYISPASIGVTTGRRKRFYAREAGEDIAESPSTTSQFTSPRTPPPPPPPPQRLTRASTMPPEWSNDAPPPAYSRYQQQYRSQFYQHQQQQQQQTPPRPIVVGGRGRTKSVGYGLRKPGLQLQTAVM